MTAQQTSLAGQTIAISGASGLVGSALKVRLLECGVRVIDLVRRPPRDGTREVQWDPARGLVDPSPVPPLDAVVHLAGENIGAGRWTTARKQRLRDSRIPATEGLCRSLAGLNPGPRTFLSASAIGYYGDRGDEVLTESSAPGKGFLADLCIEWEQASQPARDAGMRVAHLRFGVILSRDGGALPRMLLPFKLGLGGRIGSGRQYWSWVVLDDVIGAIVHVLERSDLSGPFNVVSPQPATNAEFTRMLGSVLRRPTIFPLPAFVARAVLGEMADEMLLSSARVLPARLQESGYTMQQPMLEGALRSALAARPAGTR